MKCDVKRYFIPTILAFSVLLLVSCGGVEQGDLEVSFAGKVVEKDNKIMVEGESNLLEGARLNGYVIVDDGEVLSETSELTDKDGHFTMELDHHQYGDAKVVVLFDFNSSLQEEEIVEHYGEGGQDLEGPFVYVDEHYDMEQVNRKAMVEIPLLASEEASEHEMVAQEWKERPDDYGDPRVWIELDEVTNDDDYFYIKGSSNIMEGAIVYGNYTGSSGSGEARVNKDGTFEMEIPYQYDEDAHFEIQFRPYSGQWAMVEDTYGENGEKLVGNLVEDEGNYLAAIAIIEYESK